ncbi:osteopetrosis-associated transmembrane protein 1 [Anopheles funestus]|uniref:osteopetrosis-associated transmembrane protein 1 n=1 Tax=Anopheles funestus TaxID=62324 RepID=UPI0020C6AB33|nr:osteopetrosis-associated transmembrane protein 1 [Anopheles funestus]
MAKFIPIVICFVIASTRLIVHAEPECVDIHAFLKDTSALMRSLPDHTYPVFNLCTADTAQKTFHSAVTFYRNMSNSPPCKKYLENNRLTVYQSIYAELTGLWDAANCEACTGAVNDTAKFMNLSNTLDACFARSKTPCVSCDTDYQNVQQFYASINKKQHGSGMCFDIEDRMNQTRRIWSGQYNCCKDKRHSMVIFASIASVVCVLPFLFYTLMHLAATRRERLRLSLLLVNDEPDQPSGSRNNNGVIRNSDMERIVEVDDDEENHANDSDSDGDSFHKKPPTAKFNNLDVKEGNLLDVSEFEHSSSILQPQPDPVGHKHDRHQKESDDESLLP